MNFSKIKILTIVISLFLITSCQNEPNGFEDFDYTTSYFSWQYPVRTLVLGSESYYDNSNDLLHQFEIKASMGGVYANNKNVNVEFEIDPSLLDSLAYNDGVSNVKLKMLPSNYYEPINSNIMVIKAGSFNGGVTIKLTDAFFNDPFSSTNCYVLPLRIIKSDTDSVLTGKRSQSAPTSGISSIAQKWGVDPRVTGNWVVKPKNYTIYTIKYTNKYHGYYLKRGTEKAGVDIAKSYGWEKKYIEYTPYIPKLKTLSLSQLVYDDRLALSAVKFSADLKINADNSVEITKNTSSLSNITGTGKYVTGLEKWGGKNREAFYLDYNVTDPITNKVYAVKDTLVFRDNAVAVAELIPVILE